mmetsp:Transcript_11380/g.19105  ORF Transcript_11380/g.19105 Transcript_11380/m.19105 type:complete len:477 (+) Transcript_11380:28-1458(+)
MLPSIPTKIVLGFAAAFRPLVEHYRTIRTTVPQLAVQSRFLLEQEPAGFQVDFDALGAADHGPVGVLLLSVGSPETPDDVEEYLYNVFCDPEILTLPPQFTWALKRPLAWYIAKTRSADARAAMVAAGGHSPQLATIKAQASALQDDLRERGVNAKLFIAMRYWHPFASEAVAQMKAENITKLVILPLYPQFSIATSGSALRVLERMLYTVEGFPMKSTVVPSWFNRQGFLQAASRAIVQAIGMLSPEDAKEAHVLYSAQGLPRKYIEDLGDPYQEQVEQSVALINAELKALGIENDYSLGYQGQVGPERVSWISPSTGDEILRLGSGGACVLVLVPVSFVFEHMGTLNEMDREYAAIAASCGVRSFVRVPTLGTDPSFISALSSVVMEALPDLNRPSMQQINDGTPVALNMVNEYVTLYTKDELQLVPQEQPWGFSEQAEVVNGRLAMAAITLSVALSADPTLKMLVQLYKQATE